MIDTPSLYITHTSGALDRLKPLIERAYKRAGDIVEDTINLDITTVDVIVIDDKSMVIEAIGVGGFTPSRHLCYIYINASMDVSEDEVYYTICHELHHAKRYEGEGYGTTLFDSIVFEGLATLFEEEVSGSSSHLVQELGRRQSTPELIKAQAGHFSDVPFDHFRWFIDGTDIKLPTWAGYEMGYYIARAYSRRTQKKASELVLEASDSFQGVVRDTLGVSGSL